VARLTEEKKMGGERGKMRKKQSPLLAPRGRSGFASYRG
jgi:hypothetical protein